VNDDFFERTLNAKLIVCIYNSYKYIICYSHVIAIANILDGANLKYFGEPSRSRLPQDSPLEYDKPFPSLH
jgi:hypothetical protein